MKILQKMPKLSIELVQGEQKSWSQMNEALKYADGNSIPFGKYMNDKFSLNDPVLGKEPDTAMAMLILLKDHVKEFRD